MTFILAPITSMTSYHQVCWMLRNTIWLSFVVMGNCGTQTLGMCIMRQGLETCCVTYLMWFKSWKGHTKFKLVPLFLNHKYNVRWWSPSTTMFIHRSFLGCTRILAISNLHNNMKMLFYHKYLFLMVEKLLVFLYIEMYRKYHVQLH